MRMVVALGGNALLRRDQALPAADARAIIARAIIARAIIEGRAGTCIVAGAAGTIAPPPRCIKPA